MEQRVGMFMQHRAIVSRYVALTSHCLLILLTDHRSLVAAQPGAQVLTLRDEFLEHGMAWKREGRIVSEGTLGEKPRQRDQPRVGQQFGKTQRRLPALGAAEHISRAAPTQILLRNDKAVTRLLQHSQAGV